MDLWHVTCLDIEFTKSYEIHYGEKKLFESKAEALEHIMRHKKKYHPDLHINDADLYYSITCIDTEKCKRYKRIFLQNPRKPAYKKRINKPKKKTKTDANNVGHKKPEVAA
jgi:hypothetical protein